MVKEGSSDVKGSLFLDKRVLIWHRDVPLF